MREISVKLTYLQLLLICATKKLDWRYWMPPESPWFLRKIRMRLQMRRGVRTKKIWPCVAKCESRALARYLVVAFMTLTQDAPSTLTEASARVKSDVRDQ